MARKLKSVYFGCVFVLCLCLASYVFLYTSTVTEVYDSYGGSLDTLHERKASNEKSVFDKDTAKILDNQLQLDRQNGSHRPTTKIMQSKTPKTTTIFKSETASPIINTSTKRKIGLIIVTSMRSGSSFTGQIFNQHPNVFYFFEPLYFLLGEYGSQRKLEVLDKIFTCNFTGMTSLYDDVINSSSHQSFKRDVENCRKDGFCFGRNSRALASTNGGITDWSKITRACETAELRVVKTLRIYKLFWLKRFFDDPVLDLKVLHLVRDPRAVFESRARIFNANESMKAVGHTCGMHRTVEHETRDWPGIAVTARYEDITANPHKFIESIYRFVGLAKHPNVTKWLREHTATSDNSTYGTSRRGETQLGKWRTQIKYLNALTVQEICLDVMIMFGYKKISSETEIKDLNYNLYSI
uniref:carbohydrate sulfotransferase 1-like n=1 Tax=Ciona intestinalis TaxID=7719 RepID=UPI000EF4818E|nr:carbohydrate sulfotransferase 1-like [Ciona intestinalis]|eukprot:XP_026694680.1 carbohydrate sulfotransferase 1-like [Ciona intestinalis]